jgi:hypothetical protein
MLMAVGELAGALLERADDPGDGSGYHAPKPGRLAQLGEHQLDKLGVTGSSPVPPIEKALDKGFFVARAGDDWRGCGKD